MHLTEFGRTAMLGVAVTLAAAMPVLARQDSETIEKTVAFPSNGTLKLRTFSGTVHITGTNGHDVVVKAVRHATRERLDHIKLTIDTSGSTVSIDANHRDDHWSDRDNVVETDLEIQVPASAILDVSGFSSSLDVKGVKGAEKLQTFSGDVDVDASGAGATPQLKIDTFSGSIHAHLADNTKADVAFDSFSGEFNSDIPLVMHSQHHGRSAKSDGGDAALKFHTFSGNVKVTK